MLIDTSLGYSTINRDYGCGIVAEHRAIEELIGTSKDISWLPPPPSAASVERFFATRNDFQRAFDLVSEYHPTLLRLIEPACFETIFSVMVAGWFVNMLVEELATDTRPACGLNGLACFKHSV